MKEQFTSWLSQQAAQCEERRFALAAEGRADEAKFERIRYNVYDLFGTTVNAIHRKEPNEKLAWSLFEQRLRDIPGTWQRSHDLAALHGDTEKVQVERVKLEAAEDIRRRYEAWRGAGA